MLRRLVGHSGGWVHATGVGCPRDRPAVPGRSRADAGVVGRATRRVGGGEIPRDGGPARRDRRAGGVLRRPVSTPRGTGGGRAAVHTRRRGARPGTGPAPDLVRGGGGAGPVARPLAGGDGTGQGGSTGHVGAVAALPHLCQGGPARVYREPQAGDRVPG